MILFFLLILFMCNPIKADSYIKTIAYDENQVVELDCAKGIVTTVQFSSSEKIINIQNGDAAAWSLSVSDKLPNQFSIKPTLDNSKTNMTVVTTLHTYYFHLNNTADMSKITYGLRFSYPSEGDSTVLPKPSYHSNYTFHGAPELKPISVFDDGQFTYFRFLPTQSYPAIFAVTDKFGHESLINFRQERGYLVVHQLAKQFNLRFGGHRVASVFNEDKIKGSL